MNSSKKEATLFDALIPIISLMIMLYASVRLYGSDSSSGANQIALILCAAIASLVGFKNGYSWKEIEQGIAKGIATAFGAILILMMVGSLIGSWIISGTVPTMIYYGLQLLEPNIFYVATCVICAIISISIGSSWTTAGTVGVALIGVAIGLNMSLPITAGAIISGAYFGDKMSPLSDTTNLAPAVAGTDLFTHIRHMAWTTVPSILLALVLFTLIGFFQETQEGGNDLGKTLEVIKQEFNISILALFPLLLVLFLAFKKVPAFMTLLIGALTGCIFAIILQPSSLERSIGLAKYECNPVEESRRFSKCQVEQLQNINGYQIFDASLTLNGTQKKLEMIKLPMTDEEVIELEIDGEQYQLTFTHFSTTRNTLNAVWRAMFEGYSSDSGDAAVDELLSRGGMSGMMNTIWLILTALTFGAVLETVGLLKKVVESILGLVKGTGSLITAVIGTCLTTNIIAADQYIAIVLPGRMFRAEFKRRGLDARNLSRSLEDSATMTSPLIPWNTCGVYMFGVLGVPTLAYLPFCFFNIASPFVSIIYGITNFKITRIDDSDQNSGSGSSTKSDLGINKGKNDESAVLDNG